MIVTGRDIHGDLRIETEVCVIGSGAGGAVMAKELREAGLEVVVLEEGGHFTRADFNREPFDMTRLMYRDGGATATIGFPPVLLPLGRTVGGSTTINSGTCFRTPDYVLDRWERELGLADTSPRTMERFFDRVEKIQKIGEVREELIGRNAELVRRGAQRLGYSHGTLKRNVNENCRGCGVCCFGCPSDAKMGMHLTYIPAGVGLGMKVYAHCRVERLAMRDGRLESVEGTVLDAVTRRPKHRLHVRARVFVLSGGTIMTPYLLLRNGLFNSSGQVGRNLTIHPAVRVQALFDEDVYGWRGVPQSYFVDQFKDLGIMMEGAHGPPSLMCTSVPFIGRKYADLLARIRNLAAFGVMVSDTTRGRVHAWARRPVMIYQINRYDTDRLAKGLLELSRIFFAAGAREVYPTLHNLPILRSPDELVKLERMKIKRRFLEMSAFHPLGTCRMGKDPRTSVVDTYGKVHDAKNAFISDGSIFPTSLGVNPQETIMAFSTRNAEYLAHNFRRFANA
ncbi:MAG: GMC family oxidoreductase [Nitrospirae bacterium]|nr:GMC family oxidoreductase [Nitrospirota bacterium]